MSFKQLKSSLEMIYGYKENYEEIDLRAFEKSLRDEGFDGDLDDRLYAPESDKLKKIGLTYNRIPFAHSWSGDYLLVDLDPVDNKDNGQIMNYFNSEVRMALLSPNLAEYFALYNSEIANGNIFWREDYESIEVKEGSKADKILWDS